MTVRKRLRTMSGRPGSHLQLTLNLKPRRCNLLRTAISSPVLDPRMRDITSLRFLFEKTSI